MHPVFSQAFALGAATLRGLVFVVREEQVDAARVNVYIKIFVAARAKKLLYHRYALGVPAGPSASKRTIVPFFVEFPQREVLDVFFAVVARYARD